MLKPYATLLRTPGALKFSIAGFIGRMPIAMDSLAIIFIVVAATDSYALAGALTAVGSIVVGAAEVFWSRQADRRGQAKILLLAVPTRVISFLVFVVLSFYFGQYVRSHLRSVSVSVFVLVDVPFSS